MSKENVINEIHKRGYDAFENDGRLTMLNDGYTKGFPISNIDVLLNERIIEKDGEDISFPPLAVEDIAVLMISTFNTCRDIHNGLYD